jgi:hypothetical protein
VQWTSVPDRVRYVPGVITAVIYFLPDQLFEEHATRWDPPMVAIWGESSAITEGAVMHDDAAGASARPRREVCGVAAFEVDDRKHGPPPPGRQCDTNVSPR